MPLEEQRFTTTWRVAILSALACALAVPVAVMATQPVVEMPFCDDFAYILSAVGLERTGHVIYNGWAAASLGWLMFYGALVIRLAGFSITKLHLAIVPLGMACAVLLHRIYARLGLSNLDATFGTLTIVLSLIFIPLTASMMTDVPGLLVFTLCFYLCQRAFAARTPRIACAWLVIAALSNAVGGTVRQFDWIGLFAMVPAAIWCFRRQRSVWLPAAAAWVASLAYVAYFMRWYSHQPYSLRENYLSLIPGARHVAQNLLQCLLVMGLFLLPVTVAFLLPRRTRPTRILGTLLFASGLTFLIQRIIPAWVAPFQSDWIKTSGLTIPSIVGEPPTILSLPVCLGLTVLTLATLALVFVTLVPSLQRDALRRMMLQPSSVLVGATLCMTVLLTFSRWPIFSRYYISILVLLVPILLHLYRAGGGSTDMPTVCVATLGLFTVFNVVAVHDQYAVERARLEAANVLIAHGYPRDSFWAGFEYDGWTQIMKTGTINDSRLGPPTAVYRMPPRLTGPIECRSQFASVMPDIQAVAELAFQPLPGCGPQLPGIEPLHYRAWFPPRDRAIYSLAVPPS